MKKIVRVLLVAVLFLGVIFSLSSCKKEKNHDEIVENLLRQQLIKRRMENDVILRYSYRIIRYSGKDIILYAVDIYDDGLVRPTETLILYEGMFDENN